MSTMSFDSANHLIFRTFYDTGNPIQLLKKSDSKGLGDGRRCFFLGAGGNCLRPNRSWPGKLEHNDIMP